MVSNLIFPERFKPVNRDAWLTAAVNVNIASLELSSIARPKLWVLTMTSTNSSIAKSMAE